MIKGHATQELVLAVNLPKKSNLRNKINYKQLEKKH